MNKKHPFSFRDRAGFLYYNYGKLLRQINKSFAPHFDTFIISDLYKQLVDENLIVAHQELEIKNSDIDCYKTIAPFHLPFISYPYEWCFNQLKDAALLTLQIMQNALQKQMVLKDATPFNVQFYKGKPIFIDTLSFEIYDDKKPWVAYYQFCETFLYPLLLATYNVQDVHKTFTTYPDGISAENTIKLLPKKAKYNLFNYLHLYLVGKIKSKQNVTVKGSTNVYSKTKMENLISHLYDKIKSLKNTKLQTEWNNYYAETILNETYLNHKKEIITNWASTISNEKVLDIGCNDGIFSLLFASQNEIVFATDLDASCVNNLSETIKNQQIQNVYPLVMDIMHPSTNQGFFNVERMGFFERIQPTVVLMLAVVHHLVISKNITFSMLVNALQNFAKILIIEFVPKTDEKVQQLLISKQDVFSDYSQQNFELEFAGFYTILQHQKVTGSNRILYLMQKNKYAKN